MVASTRPNENVGTSEAETHYRSQLQGCFNLHQVGENDGSSNTTVNTGLQDSQVATQS